MFCYFFPSHSVSMLHFFCIWIFFPFFVPLIISPPFSLPFLISTSLIQSLISLFLIKSLSSFLLSPCSPASFFPIQPSFPLSSSSVLLPCSFLHFPYSPTVPSLLSQCLICFFPRQSLFLSSFIHWLYFPLSLLCRSLVFLSCLPIVLLSTLFFLYPSP